MQMTPVKLIGLRLFNVTLGRTAWANRLLRRGLVMLLISRRERGDRYMASSRFFDPRELDRT
jgi:hypothetical protein